MYYLGIDISKKSFTFSILDEEGEAITKPLTCPSTRRGMEKLVEKISSLNPYQTRKYHQVLSKKAKTDKVDSLVIAGLLRSKEALASSCSVKMKFKFSGSW